MIYIFKKNHHDQLLNVTTSNMYNDSCDVKGIVSNKHLFKQYLDKIYTDT